jgi:hypothetical protein
VTGLRSGPSPAAGRRVLVLGQLDRFANGLKPRAIERFLRERGHEVTLVDTDALSRASARRNSVGHHLPAPDAERLALFAVEVAGRLLTRRWSVTRRRLSAPLLRISLALRRRILRTALPLEGVDLIICETPYDAGVLLDVAGTRTLYDCPTPWADELLYEGRLTPRQHRRFRRAEVELYEGVDHLAFHWESYARYACEQYGISGHNLLTLNFGCTPAEQRASSADLPRGVYLGSLSSKFIDLGLLSRLTRLYPHIDVYGGPEPDARLGLNYRGWAPPEILREYQFGVVTCTRDPLRSNGFSAKHLEYLAYGLPTLVPAWRRHLELLRGSVPYEEGTFRSAVEALADPEYWQRLSDAAYDQARRLAWDETLRPLQTLLDSLEPGPGVRRGG